MAEGLAARQQQGPLKDSLGTTNYLYCGNHEATTLMNVNNALEMGMILRSMAISRELAKRVGIEIDFKLRESSPSSPPTSSNDKDDDDGTTSDDDDDQDQPGKDSNRDTHTDNKDTHTDKEDTCSFAVWLRRRIFRNRCVEW